MTEFMDKPGKYRVNVEFFTEKSAKRKKNQDNYYIGGPVNLLSVPAVSGTDRIDTDVPQVIALFDGMGGETDGGTAAVFAAEAMEYFALPAAQELSREAVAEAVRSYYGIFMDRLNDYMDGDSSVCGTTCAAVVIQADTLVPFWLGDSRAYLLRSGTLHRLTKDHSEGQARIDSGLLTEEEARKTPSWHYLTGYMGQFDGAFSVGAPVKLLPGDRIFLCTDGITDVYRDQELESILRCGSAKAMAQLAAMAAEEASDNCTAILIEPTDSSWRSILKKITGRM